VSGTESGSLLLWEGNFIKCKFVLVSGGSCHEGEVTHVSLDRQERVLITAGMDGVIRMWDFDAIDTAEVDADVSLDFALHPVCEYRPPFLPASQPGAPLAQKQIGIRTLVDSGPTTNSEGDALRTFVVQDTKGRTTAVTFSLSTPVEFPLFEGEAHPGPVLSITRALVGLKLDAGCITVSIRKVCDSHAGKINGMDTSPLTHLAVTGGDDGTVRLWDYLDRKIVGKRDFRVPVTCVKWCPLSVDLSGYSVAVGFADGIVRVLTIAYDTFGTFAQLKRKFVCKPHNAPVVDICFSNNGNYVATAGKDGIVFFLKCANNSHKTHAAGSISWTPLKFVTVASPLLATTHQLSQQQILAGKGPFYAEAVSWNMADDAVLMSCSDSMLRQVSLTGMEAAVASNSEEFEAFFPVEEFAANVAMVLKDPQMTGSNSAASLNGAASAPASPIKVPSMSVSNLDADNASDDANAAATSTNSSVTLLPIKMGMAVYAAGAQKEISDIVTAGVVTGPSGGSSANLNWNRALLAETSVGGILPVKEVRN
jgi:WD40 repeat protein